MIDSPDKTLLIVEDEAMILELAVMTLEESGGVTTIMQAMNVDQALQQLEGIDHIDALITDVQMPGSRDGLDLASIVRQRFPRCAIIIVSGRPLPNDRAVPSGSKYVPKPWSPSALIEVVHQQIAALRATR